MPSKEDIDRQIEDLLQTAGIRPDTSEEVQREEYQLWMKASRILNSDQADSKAQEALSMLETALSRLKPSDERLRAQCLSAAAVAASYLGQIEKTVEYGKRALQILDRTGPPIFAAMTRDHLARVLEQAGRDDEAKRLRQEAHTDMDTADAALRNWDERYGRRTRKWWQFWK